MKLYKKYESIITYIFFGGCATVINIISYYIFAHLMHLGTTISTILAWLISVLFAFVTNKLWVFKSKSLEKELIIKELVSFISCRILTGLLDLAIMFVFVDVFNFNDMIIKIVSNIIVIILNYVASKLFVFKK